MTFESAWAARDVLLGLSGEEDAPARAEAARWIVRERAGAAAHALADALYDSHPSVRLEACRGAAKLGRADALPIVRRLALEEPIWWVRRAAVLAVARLAGRSALPLLRRVLDDPFWRVRHAAVRAILLLTRGDADASLLELQGASGDSERVRGALAYLEARLGLAPRSAANATIPSFTGKTWDPDPAVVTARLERGAAASAAELAFYVGDPHEALRRAAASRLRRTKDVRALLAAAIWLEEPRIPHATAAVVALLDRLPEDAADELLAAALADPDARPGLAVWALSCAASAEDALRAMDARSALARRAAIGAVGRLLASRGARGDGARTALRERAVRALADADEDVRRLAVHALATEAHEDGLAALRALPFAGEPALVRRILAQVHAPAPSNELRAAVGDDDPDTRATATAALFAAGALDDDAIAAARADADPWIRAAVLDAASAIAALRGDPDARLRQAAFECAARGGLALEAARIACTDGDEALRVRAAACLARAAFDSDEDLVRVLVLTRDPALAVRAAAADAARSARDLTERLARVRADGRVRDAADTWLGLRAPELMAAAAVAPPSPPSPSRPEPRRPSPVVAHGRALAPLIVSGANEPSVAALFRAWSEGANTFFWEPRYRNLTTFLRTAGERGQETVVVAGTYHATASAIRADVARACRRLRRRRIDLFLVFWTRSAARLDGEVAGVLAELRAEGKIGGAGFSTHDRALAETKIGAPPWDAIMVRHSAAHPGAEERLFPRAAAAGTAVLAFSATSYGRLLRRAHPDVAPPTAAECYRYALAQPGVTACVCAPRGGVELFEDLAVLRAPPLDAARIAELRAHGLAVREESLDFASRIRRFPAIPDDAARALDDELSCEDEGFSSSLETSWSPSQG